MWNDSEFIDSSAIIVLSNRHTFCFPFPLSLTFNTVSSPRSPQAVWRLLGKGWGSIFVWHEPSAPLSNTICRYIWTYTPVHISEPPAQRRSSYKCSKCSLHTYSLAQCTVNEVMREPERVWLTKHYYGWLSKNWSIIRLLGYTGSVVLSLQMSTKQNKLLFKHGSA